jgi:hypothetical protein
MKMNRFWFITIIAILFSFCQMAMADNMALELAGDPESFFEAPDNPTFDSDLEDLTLEAWVNPADNVGERMILNKEDVYEIAIVDGIFKTAIRPAEQGWDWISSGEEANVPANAWTHVAITYDRERTRLFIGGVLMAESDGWTGKLNDSPDTFKVGRRTRGDDTHSIYSGLIDEVRVSSVVRYTGDFDVPTQYFKPDDDTVALYHFDEAHETVVEDASKNGNHGNLMKDAVLVPADTPIVPADTPIEPGAVQAAGKLAITWGKMKSE